jgi:2-dehydropantoate 2-reductase
LDAALQEVIDVGQAQGLDLHRGDVQDWYAVLRALSRERKTFMLHDIEAGRTTEVEIFGVEVHALGTYVRFFVPVNETLYRCLRTLAEMWGKPHQNF